MHIKDSVITFDIHERCLGIVRAVVDGRGDVGEDGDEEEEVDEADAVAVEHHLQRTGQMTGGFETIYLRVCCPELPDGFLLHVPDDGVRHEGEADHQHAGQVEARGQLECSAVQFSHVEAYLAVGQGEQHQAETHEARGDKVQQPVPLALQHRSIINSKALFQT